MEELKKTPLGFILRKFWIENLTIRYFDVEKEIPLELILEWNELIQNKGLLIKED